MKAQRTWNYALTALMGALLTLTVLSTSVLGLLVAAYSIRSHKRSGVG